MIKKLRRIFFLETSLNEKLLIFHICMIYAICSSCFIGISVWFKQPTILCRDHTTLQQSICSEEFACDNKQISYHINNKIGPNTLASELFLICDRKIIHRLLLSMMFFGGFLGCFLNALVYIPPTRRKTALSFLCLLLVVAKIGVLTFYNNVYTLGVFLGLISFCCIIINSYCFALINEMFLGEVSKMATVLMTLMWGVFGILFAGFCYAFDSNWRVIFWTVSAMILIVSISLLLLENEKGIKETSSKEPNNLVEFLKDIKNSKEDRSNFMICLLIWTATSLTYNDILLELENVGQSIYINMSLIALIELMAGYTAGFIVLKYNILNTIRNLLSFSIILYLGFYFMPKASQNNILFIIFLSCKLFSEIIYNLMNIYTPKVIADKYVANFFIFTRLFSRILLLFLPHVNQLFRFLGIHPFVFLSIIYGISRFLINFIHEPIKPIYHLTNLKPQIYGYKSEKNDDKS